MSKSPSRFPLQWPAHRPRTDSWKRKPGRFKADGRDITAAVAMGRCEEELERMGGVYPILSSNLELRMDGRPRSGKAPPTDPGVCLYFSLKSEPFALACDRYSSAPQNIAAIAAHLEATRAIERHGVASAAESLRAFSALPPPDVSTSPQARPWRAVLGLSDGFPSEDLDLDVAATIINGRWRKLAASAHPDKGGSEAGMADLNRARDEALAHVERELQR